MSIGISGIERLADEFESRGFSTRKSLQYLQVSDLDYIFSSPKRLLLAEKRALDHELRQLKLLITRTWQYCTFNAEAVAV